MKVRIGVILGIDGGTDPEELSAAVIAMEELGFDSLWLAERLSTGIPDVVAGLAFAAARTTRLKLGTGVVVLPGRNPAVVAKQLATVDRLSQGRLLVAFGSGLPDPDERALLPVPAGRRGEVFDETLTAVRAYLSPGSPVRPAPVQQPLDLWVGGNAPAALDRAGRLADGWLPSLISPGEAKAGRERVEEAASRSGRRIDPGHFGVTFFYTDNGTLPAPLAAAIARRRPGVDPATLAPSGLPGAVDFIGRCLDAGFSKFVVRPTTTPASWPATLEAMADALLPLQT